MPPRAFLLGLLLTASALAAPAPRAQPLVDGITAGLSLAMFQGDVDGNPGNGPVEYLSFGNVGAFVGADRKLGPIVGEAVLHLDRLDLENRFVAMRLNVASLDLTAGLPIGLGRPGFLRLYAGVSPSLLMPSYERVDERIESNDTVDFERVGTRLQVTFPVGVVVHDVLRVGVRFTGSDRVDGWTSPTGFSDLISYVSVGYRFDLLR